ncbi:hypothetical protein Tco_0738688 [Tanacetum coccineum]
MYVRDQNVEEDVKDVGFVAIEKVTFKQIMDEVDLKTQDAQENDESPYDTKSEIKIIKSYQAATISGSLFIHQSSSYNQDVIDITPKDAKEGDASKSLYGLRFMPGDGLASMTGFETQDSADHVFKDGTETLHASVDKPAQSDPLSHLHEELCLLHNKLHGLLSDALKDTLPQLIKEPIKRFVLESITEELPQVEAQICFTSKGSEQIPSQQNEKIHQTEGPKRDERSSGQALFLCIHCGHKLPTCSGSSDHISGHGFPPRSSITSPVNEEKALVLHNSEEKCSEEDTSRKKETNDEPPAKKLKFLIPSSSIPSPTPLEPTPPRYESKGKGIATEDPLKNIMPFMEKGGSTSKISSLESFVIPEGPLSQEKVMAQL